MKTLCLTVLMLFTVCCRAMPASLRTRTMPVTCCFKFSPQQIKETFIASITETHRSCPHQAFVVHTVKGRKICYSRTFPWALEVYNRLHSVEGSV